MQSSSRRWAPRKYGERAELVADLRFSWELSGSGWATCRVADGSAERKDVVSYCTDALADLLDGVADLYAPGTVHRFSFDLEPAEIRWVLRGLGRDVDIEIYRFPDMSASFDAPDDHGALVWSSRQDRGALSHAVVEAAQSVLRLHGEEGYRAKWVLHPFPLAALQDLRRLHLRYDGCDIPHDMPLP
ncbi:hypothetical protein P3T37_002686 [Kitasatospora sp. MAA4]|uniref:hypothetical protein n=1 Tax=Kitasatospora sp. MAA4 TaxID=3035093 RepID=UPI002474A4FF|nr:hypothetical protein [Kitasatospora sp. MAA4]MDH6133291.1 hypothetical protein [Kitasatospora sp. MAA4]